MRKLPVVATYANVMRFAFGRFFTTLRLSWLPMALLIAVVVAFFALASSTVPQVDPRSTAGVQAYDRFFYLIVAMEAVVSLLQLIALSAVAVSIHRVILFGDTKSGVWFNFPFGATERRFLAMGILFVLMVVGVILLFVAPVLYLVSGGDFIRFFRGWPEGMILLTRSGQFAPLIVAYLAGWLMVLFLFVRLSLWPPSVVASGRLSPAEAWRLTRGNFWNLIGLFVLTVATLCAMFLPIGIGVAVFVAMRFRDVMEVRQGQALATMPEKVFEPLLPLLPIAAVLYFLLIVFVTSVMVAVVSYAYKALKGVDTEAPIAL